MQKHVLVDFVLARLLRDLGFARKLDTDEDSLARAVYRYQDFHGLEPDSWVGPETRASLLAPRFCGHPDVMAVQNAETLCRWTHKAVTYRIQGQLPGMTPEQLAETYRHAWQQWAEVCDLDPVAIAGAPNVLAATGPIDGAQGVLAWSELPCDPARRQLRQLYDSSERWGQGIDPLAVMTHEIGHALGIAHLGAGNLMAPFISQIRKPQAGDISEAVKRYGARPGLPPPVAEEYVLTFRQPVTQLLLRRVA